MKALLLILLVLGVLVSPGYALPQTVETLVNRTITPSSTSQALGSGPYSSNCAAGSTFLCAFALSWTWTNPNRVTWEIRLSSVTFQLCKSGAGSLPSGNMRAEIFASTGTLPTGTALATSATRPLSDVVTTGACSDTFAFTFTEPSRITVSANTEYFAALESLNSTNYTGVVVQITSVSGSEEFARYYSNQWNAGIGSVAFYLVVEGVDPSIPAQLNQARYVFGVLFVLVLVGGGLSLAYSFFEPDTRGFSRAQLKAKELPIIVALYLSVLAVIGFLAVLYP